MLQKIDKYMQKYHMLEEGDTVAAGISGGADSVCLLFLLHELTKRMKLRVLVVHVNHGIRQEAAEDAAYVQKLCEEWGFPFYLVEADIPRQAAELGMSEEETGRHVRYESFQRVLQEQAPLAVAEGHAKIAVAHNSNDRAETMLFHLCRGTGPEGLRGIRPVRGQIIRPLLCVQRQEIEQFLQMQKISYCIDRTNDEDTYTRNKIRHHTLPYLEKEICSETVSHMNHTADLLEQNMDYIRQQTIEAAERCVVFENDVGVINGDERGKLWIRVPELKACHIFLQKQIILYCMEQIASAKKDLTSVHVEQVLALLEKEGSRQVMLPYHMRALKEYDRVWLYQEKRDGADTAGAMSKHPKEYRIEPPCSMEIDGLGILDFTVEDYEKCQEIPQNAYTKWLDYDKIKECLMLRTRRTGDYLTINEKLAKKSLKDYMIQEKIPCARRKDIWILADGSHVLWVIGHRISQEYKISGDTKHILKIQLRGGQSWQNM